MKAKMRFSLKAGERIFINGAVLTVSQKVTLSLLNEARFLLESHVLQVTEATTPMRQLYFVVQSLLINPQEAGKVMGAFRKLHDALVQVAADEGVKDTLGKVGDLVEADRTFDALKLIRTLFEPVEAQQSAPAEPAAVQAA
ncbi:flagellar biosynthesis repressor FlbT [Microvirga sp. 3-52]|jgi:flagellar biosynthesis repressor protein FlbT|uniref:flagellar biosynthesis repressor FlbT n=1 Tax=Microvirga sp. 3-52 TaxID=2792425 RepID=UPI001AD56573|nr:flagellar biosynthesis repressor FlbT [Microvirga sp. 3-52]MBO1904404.1 flagellar biosynthesis repressor FlbT [Microvirga sp. 3-52]MBS7451426.1 flagellar biosynthesis repressor FlbT [Microvirga sp. 3-52]